MDLFYSIVRNIWEALLELKNRLPWPSGQTPQEKEVHLDKAVADEIARQVARQIGELSPRKADDAGPVKAHPPKDINIKTGYVPGTLDTKTDEEEIQTNIGSIRSEEEESNDIEISLKALKKIGGKRQEKN